MNPALHEAAHVVVAHVLGVQVVHAIGVGDDPHVRTRHWIGGPAEENARWPRRLAIIDLAAVTLEENPATTASDRANEMRRISELGGDPDTIAHLLTVTAGRLVRKHHAAIARVAQRLEEAGEAGLSGAAIDELL
jgi:hypothetical protein